MTEGKGLPTLHSLPVNGPCFILLECYKHAFLSGVVLIQSNVFWIKLHLGGGYASQRSHPSLNLDDIKNMFHVMER